ncbi:MAG: Spy/CpxP family protein refolding chaperone [Acidobacteriota bacterium]
MRKRILAIAGIAALIIGATVFAVAQSGLIKGHHQRGEGQERHGGPGMHGGPEMIEHMARALGLTEEQKTQIKGIMEAARPAEEARDQKSEELHKQLEAATANGQFDEAKVRDLANQQAQLMAESIVDHERMKAKIYSLLSADQRSKADEMHKRGGERMRHQGPPPPPSE